MRTRNKLLASLPTATYKYFKVKVFKLLDITPKNNINETNQNLGKKMHFEKC
jgi:hypothetical protein